jgi:hypothetical protein
VPASGIGADVPQIPPVQTFERHSLAAEHESPLSFPQTLSFAQTFDAHAFDEGQELPFGMGLWQVPVESWHQPPGQSVSLVHIPQRPFGAHDPLRHELETWQGWPLGVPQR